MNNFPINFEFSTTLPICIEHINYGNHLAHDKLVSLLHEARVRYFLQRKKEERNLLLTHLEVNYIKEAFYGEHLNFKLAYSQQGPCSGIFFYKVTRNEELIAKASTKIVFFDYTKRKIVRGSL